VSARYPLSSSLTTDRHHESSESLFAPTSLSLKSTGFSLLSVAIQRLPPFDIPALFGEGVMRTLSNHLRKSGEAEKTLARVAEKVVRPFLVFLASSRTDLGHTLLGLFSNCIPFYQSFRSLAPLESTCRAPSWIAFF
jgi:hypothetical protein